MKVIVADKISERGVKLLKEQAGWNIVLTTKDNLVAEIADAQALIVRSATKVNADLLDKAPQLKAVGRAGVGVDNIDLEAATKRGIIVMSTPGGNAVSVAEHAFALMLSAARQVPRMDKAFHEGRWEKGSGGGTEMSGKTLGLIGLGRIGSEVAVRAEAFDMRIVAYDPYISEAAAKEFSVELVQLDQLFAESDFISLHTALSPATQNLLNAAAFAKMKKGVFIVNAARGELIDEKALTEALKSGQVAGAGLDVFAQEPPKDTPLAQLPNVVGTPHIAGSTTEAQEEVGTQVAVQIRDYLADGIIRNAVNLPVLSATNIKRVRPYLSLAQRLGSLVAQAAEIAAITHSNPLRRRSRRSGTHLLRSAVLAGVLNAVLDEKVNVVNAPAIATARGLKVEEETRKREHGFPEHARNRSVARRQIPRAGLQCGRHRAARRHAAPSADRRYSAGSAARRHHPLSAQSRRTRRHRPGRHHARQIRREHRDVCLGPQRSQTGRLGGVAGAARWRRIQFHPRTLAGYSRSHRSQVAAPGLYRLRDEPQFNLTGFRTLLRLVTSSAQSGPVVTEGAQVALIPHRYFPKIYMSIGI